MKKILSLLLFTILSVTLFTGCGSKTETIEIPELNNNVTFGNLKLDDSRYTVTEDGDNKTIKVSLTYNKDVMIVGVITKIRNTVARELGNKYNRIDLEILQFKPMDSVSYTYENGKWDKEVE